MTNLRLLLKKYRPLLKKVWFRVFVWCLVAWVLSETYNTAVIVPRRRRRREEALNVLRRGPVLRTGWRVLTPWDECEGSHTKPERGDGFEKAREPQERVVWSPDGERAVVLTMEGTYVCDAGGKIGRALAPPAGVACWLPDSKHVLLARRMTVRTWAECRLLPAPVRRRIWAGAEAWRARAHGFIVPVCQASRERSCYEEAQAQALYLRQTYPEEELRRMGAGRLELFEKAQCAVWKLQRCTITGLSIRVDGVVAASLEKEVLSVVCSPMGKVFAYTAGSGDPWDFTIGPPSLFVCSADGEGPPRMVAGLCSAFFDWSPDGRALVYARTGAPKSEGTDLSDDLRMGAIRYHPVCGADGKLLKALRSGWAEARGMFDAADGISLSGPGGKDEAWDMVAVAFYDRMRTRRLADGTILFSGVEMRLPITQAEEAKPTLFRVGVKDARPRAIIPPKGLGRQHIVELFSVSPDGRRACIPASPDRVAIVEIATGTLQRVPSAVDGAAKEQNLVSVPTWRSGDSLCLVIWKKEKMQLRPEVVLWSPSTGKVDVISQGWPEEVISGLARAAGYHEPIGRKPASRPKVSQP